MKKSPFYEKRTINEAAAQMGRKGGARRAKMLSPERRREIGRMGGLAVQAKNRAKKEAVDKSL